MPDNDGWNEWSRHVLKELERMNARQDRMDDRLGRIETEIATLKVQAGLWGAVAGIIPAIGVAIFHMMAQK
jgi:hypothetical protein